MRAFRLRWLAVFLLGSIGFAWADVPESENLVDTSCTYSLLKSFGKPGPGGNPNAKLLLASDGLLYGTTEFGGSNNFGTVFKLNPDGSGYTAIAHFDPQTAGVHPYSKLIEGADGALYGTTQEGGSANGGTVFRVEP